MITIDSVSSIILNWVTTILAIIVPIGIIGLLWWWNKKRKHFGQFKVVIFNFDGAGNVITTQDDAGIFVHKGTKAKRLWLKKGKVGLSADNIPFILTQRGKQIYLLKIGAKNYRYIKFNFKNNFEIEVGEEDVNWGVQTYEINKKQFMSDKLMQYLPYISLALVSMVIVIIFIYFFKQFGVLREVAVQFKETAKQLVLAKTTIIQ